MQQLISVVIPAFNEEACVDELSRRLAAVADTLRGRFAFEFVIVENGSVDLTYPRLLAIHDRDPRFKIIRLSRNFGMEGGVTAGLQAATGEAAIIMCADLQDPPELIPEFIAKWEAGYQMVYGEITRRSDEGWLRQRLTSVFYWLLNHATTHKVPRNVSDFRLVSKKMYQTLNRLPERHRMLRSMWGWVGFASIGVPYGRPPRHAGKSTYQLFRNIGFGLHGIAVSSIAPLKLIPYAGFTTGGTRFWLFTRVRRPLGCTRRAVRWIRYHRLIATGALRLTFFTHGCHG